VSIVTKSEAMQDQPMEDQPMEDQPMEDQAVSDQGVSDQAVRDSVRRRGVRIGAYAAAGALAVGLGFGLVKVAGSSGPAPVASAIPSPAQGSNAFVEDDNLTAQDNQSNILQSTAPGLVHIITHGTAAGIGMVLTPSGKVLTTYQPGHGTASLTAQYIVSGVTFKATVIGTDAAAGLALLQLEGGDGRAFSTVQVGNSATIVSSTDASKQFSYHVPGEVVDTAVGTSGTQDALTVDVGTLASMNATATAGGVSRTGLMASVLQSPPATAIGGPLVNLNGQVIGVNVAGGGSGLAITGYAIPINTALADAAQIDARANHS
jgi:S1-C subfamily serine protease